MGGRRLAQKRVRKGKKQNVLRLEPVQEGGVRGRFQHFHTQQKERPNGGIGPKKAAASSKAGGNRRA